MNWRAILDILELLRVERDAEVVCNEEAGRTIVRFGMAVFMFVIVFVDDSGKGNGYQITTDSHRYHAAGVPDVDPIMPQDRSPLSDVQNPKIRFNILARMDRLCPIYW